MNSDLAVALSNAKMTRAELAHALGVSPTTVSNWGGFFPQYAVAFLAERKRVVELEARLVQMATELAKERK